MIFVVACAINVHAKVVPAGDLDAEGGVVASDHNAVSLQTGGLSLAYVTYRVGLAVYFSAVVLRCFLVYGLDYMCLLYLTNWTFLVQTVHIVIQATVVVREYALKLMHRGMYVYTV